MLKAAFLSPRTYAIVLAASLGMGALGAAVPSAARAAEDDEEAAPAAAPVNREHPELSYARNLAFGWSWYDVALDVLDSLEKSRPAAPVLQELKILRLELKTAWITSGAYKEPAKREEELEKIRKEYEEIAKREPDSDAGVSARLKIGEMLLQEGDGAVARMKQTEDAEVRAQSRKEAEEKYEKGRKYFAELKDRFFQAIDKVGNDETKIKTAHHRHLQAWYYSARSLYNIAQLFESGSKERNDRLTKCAEMFAEINFEYTDQYLGYESAIYLGLCTKELNRVPEASAAFESALGIKDFFDRDDQGNYLLDQGAQDIVSRACYFKAQMLNEVKDFEGALKSVKDMFDLMPSLSKSPLGFAARIEEGKAWAGKGDAKKAIQLLEKVRDDAKGTSWAATTVEAIALIQGGGAGGSVAPEKGISTAKVAIDRGRIAEGLAGLRFLIAQLEGAPPEEQKKWLPIAWNELGRAYMNEGRFDEAAASFEALVARTKDKDLAPGALFQCAMAYLQANSAKNNDFDKNKYLDTLKKLQKDFPDDDAAKASSFFLGIERYSARDYLTAAKEFEKTAPSAKKLYDVALYQTGLCYYMEGRRLASDKEKKDEAGAKAMFAQAQVALKKAIDWAANEAHEKGGVPREGERAASLKKIAFDARCRLAEVFGHPLMRDAEKALAAAQEAEQGLGAGAEQEKVAEARYLAVVAFLLSDKAEKAEEIVASMGVDCPKAPRTALAEREVGAAFDRLAEAARKANPAGAKDHFRKAADHLTRWLALSLEAEVDLGAKDGGRDLTRAADKLYIYAKLLNGLDEEKTQSFVEVEDLTKLTEAARFLSAAKAYAEVLKTPAADWKVGIKLGQCFGFARDFAKAKEQLFSVCQTEKILKIETEKGEKGKDVQVTNIDVKVAGANPFLLFAYQDYASACFQLATANKDRALVDEVIGAAARIIQVAPTGQEAWWRAKYLVLAALYEKGEYGDATIGLRQLERQNPDFDKNKFGLRARFGALKQRIESKAPAPAKGGGK